MTFFKDSHGKVVIAQRPNLPIIVWLAFSIAAYLTTGTLERDLSLLGNTALIVWALLEIIRGVNYFRKTLGIIVLMIVLITVLHYAI